MMGSTLTSLIVPQARRCRSGCSRRCTGPTVASAARPVGGAPVASPPDAGRPDGRPADVPGSGRKAAGVLDERTEAGGVGGRQLAGVELPAPVARAGARQVHA